jgi:sulfatase maturation enzyme AslB (radical SAM superfamily)
MTIHYPEYRLINPYHEHRQLIIMVTRACQLDCVYCQFDRTKPSMTRETLRASIDLLMTARHPEVKIQFFGGEPLLRMDLVMEGIEYAQAAAKKAGKTVGFIITTNTFALTDELRAKLDKIGVVWILSFDGDADTQDDQRPLRSGGTKFAPAIEQIGKVAASGAPYLVNMTVTPEHAFDTTRNALRLLDAGVRAISFGNRMGTDWSDERAVAYFRGIQTFLEEAKRRDLRLFVLNPVGRDEPMIISPTAIVDCDGSFYTGSVVPPLEKMLPNVVKVVYLGHLRDMTDFEQLRVDRAKLWHRLREAMKGKPEEAIVASGLRMGQLSNAFFDRMVARGLCPGPATPLSPAPKEDLVA